MNRPLPNSYWVIPGRLLAGEYPIGGDYSDARARLARFREAGINYFIDLTEKGELPAYRHLLPVYTRYQHSPIADTCLPTSATQVLGLLSDIRARSRRNAASTFIVARALAAPDSLWVVIWRTLPAMARQPSKS